MAPLENLLQVPGLGDLSVFAQLTGPRKAEHIQLTLDAGPLRGRVQGTLNLTDIAADLDYTLTRDRDDSASRPFVAKRRPEGTLARHGERTGRRRAPVG